METQTDIQVMKSEIVKQYNPYDIYLFGCTNKELFTYVTGCNLCLILDVDNNRDFLKCISREIAADFDYDVMIYTKEEWYKYRSEQDTYANIIYNTGISLLAF
ncbi:hypothetical protein [Desulfuribacillus alkaliarsenatis]|uniref:Uncharacterized protein n=1 Tax=Desulfuribacillus alkaliarsenatis TaxID=766136 RepID=A0A1E5G325_9FIRM|nr:hypothetical protein [Desulfuribacillus alkaliarsenatis]OEF97476.1 hypothetical protein BHF68_04520 [Desulfuribacillus alkaliarsenatis]